MRKTIYLLIALSMLLAACATQQNDNDPVQDNNDLVGKSEEKNIINAGFHIITIAGWEMHPANLTVYEGDRVQWKNQMPFVKRIWIWGEEPSPVIYPGKTWSYIFKEPGFYKYRDKFNQDIDGNITVLPYEERPDIKERMAEE